MTKLNQYRDTTRGLTDLLNYASMIEEGILLNKDGSLTAGFEYRAQDISSATYHDRNIIASKMNQFLCKLGTGWAIHIDATRTPVYEYPSETENCFPDRITKLIDEERRQWFLSEDEHYETTFTIILTYLPPHRAKSQLKELIYSGGESDKTDLHSKMLTEFKTKIAEFFSLASNIVQIKKMMPKEVIDEYGQKHLQCPLLSYITFAISGNKHAINVPPVAMYLDCYVGGYDFITGINPKIENNYIGIVAIDGFPQESVPNILDNLSKLNTTYRWNTRFIFMDTYEALTIFNKFKRKWQQKIKGWKEQLFNLPSTYRDEHAIAMVDEINSAAHSINAGDLAYGFYSSVIILTNTNMNDLQANCLEVKRIIENLGFVARIEDINAVESWLGSLPGHVVQNIRRPLISTFNLAHLMPLSSIWAGDKYCPNDKFPPHSPALMYVQTIDSTPFRLNVHVNDVGHTLIFGPTGSGKSTLLATLVAQFRRYKNAKIYAFDKGNSLLALTLAAGGQHLNIGSSEEILSLAPLGNVDSNAEQAWAEDWIISCLKLQGIVLSPEQKKIIHEAMNTHREANSHSITDFISNLQDKSLKDALRPYSLEGTLGSLLDGTEDVFHLTNFVTCEIENLMGYNAEFVIPTLLYLFHKIEKSLDGNPAMLLLDEAWIMLGHEVFRNKIKEWLKVLRKSNCFVVMATQSLSDAANSGILDILQEQCPTRILLPNDQAFNKGSDKQNGPYDYYTFFGLNDRQIEIIANATPKREYYYTSSLGSRLFSLSLGQIALAFVGASSKEDIKEIYKLYKEYGNEWPYKWLNSKQIDIGKYIGG
ncbi:MAG: conjugal transfer protein TrbE [Endomicrobium sp.]|jgi:type IV secretion system protein VirB4|nr:conjugal transfer protein TrbE [Endomicrobium sp.]